MNELQKDLPTAHQMLKCEYFLKNVAEKFRDIALYILVIVLYIVALFSPIFVGILTENIVWGGDNAACWYSVTYGDCGNDQ